MRYNGFIGPTLVCLTNWHFDRSFRFCRAHPCAQRTNTKITKLAMYVAIGRIYAIKLCTMSALAACICIGYVGYNKLVHNLAVSQNAFRISFAMHTAQSIVCFLRFYAACVFSISLQVQGGPCVATLPCEVLGSIDCRV